MALKLKIPLKYKFLGVLMFVMLLGFTTFFTLAYHTFSEDKKLFVMELNLALLKTALSDVKADLKSRMDELQAFIPKVYQPSGTTSSTDAFRGLNVQHLPEELLGVTFYRHKLENNSYEVLKQYKNSELFQKKSLADDSLAQIEKNHPVPLAKFNFDEGMQLINRSLLMGAKGSEQEVSVLSILIPGNFVNDESKSIVIVVDLLQDFLRKKLQQSEIADVFLITKSGVLLSHSAPSMLIQYSLQPFDHPIVERLQTKQFPRESLELQVNDEAYLCNVAETGLTDIYAISQIKQSEAFVALKTLMRQTLLTGIFILSIALILSIIFANRLTRNIQKLRAAAENIGRGQFDNQLDIESNDEVQNVAESFRWMSNRITELIEESATKARMEEELETAKLVQSTLLTTPNINCDAVEISPYYLPASECGGDVWDAFLADDILTVVIGDATGHGAPAAIVTAVAKSCISTLNAVYDGRSLAPEQLLEQLNAVVYASCKGQLLMTMCLLQLDLRTGELLVCNAGHESPMCLRAEGQSPTDSTGEKKKGTCDIFFSRGERLGFSPDSKYEAITVKLELNDSVLLYTDGISEAVNSEAKQWGERALKKVFSKAGVRPLDKIRDDLVNGVKEFMGSANQADDITFVLLQWKKAIEGAPRQKVAYTPKNLGATQFTQRVAVVEDIAAVPESVPIVATAPTENQAQVQEPLVVNGDSSPSVATSSEGNENANPALQLVTEIANSELPQTESKESAIQEDAAPQAAAPATAPESTSSLVEFIMKSVAEKSDAGIRSTAASDSSHVQEEPQEPMHMSGLGTQYDPDTDLGELATPMEEGEFCELPLRFEQRELSHPEIDAEFCELPQENDFCELPEGGVIGDYCEMPNQLLPPDPANEITNVSEIAPTASNPLLNIFSEALKEEVSKSTLKVLEIPAELAQFTTKSSAKSISFANIAIAQNANIKPEAQVNSYTNVPPTLNIAPPNATLNTSPLVGPPPSTAPLTEAKSEPAKVVTPSNIETLANLAENAEETLDRNYARIEDIIDLEKYPLVGGSDDEAA